MIIVNFREPSKDLSRSLVSVGEVATIETGVIRKKQQNTKYVFISLPKTIHCETTVTNPYWPPFTDQLFSFGIEHTIKSEAVNVISIGSVLTC